MIQLQLCVRRNPEVSIEAFRKHWKSVQAEAVNEIRIALGASRAFQALTLEIERNQSIQKNYHTAPPFDGIITLTFDSPKDLVAKVELPAVTSQLMKIYQEHLPFTDLPQCSVFYTEMPVELGIKNPLGRDDDLGSYIVEEEPNDGA